MIDLITAAYANMKANSGEEKYYPQANGEMHYVDVYKRQVIEPDGVDLSLYRRIGEEVTRVARHKLGMLSVKEINALKDNMQLPSEGQKSVEIAPMPLMPVDKCIADSQSAC